MKHFVLIVFMLCMWFDSKKVKFLKIFLDQVAERLTFIVILNRYKSQGGCVIILYNNYRLM